MFTVTYKKTTELSETLDSYHSSSLAVDGVTFWPQNSNLAAVSSWSPVPWLMIQLDTMHSIEKIVFYAADGVNGKLLIILFVCFIWSNVRALNKTSAIYWTKKRNGCWGYTKYFCCKREINIGIKPQEASVADFNIFFLKVAYSMKLCWRLQIHSFSDFFYRNAVNVVIKRSWNFHAS